MQVGVCVYLWLSEMRFSSACEVESRMMALDFPSAVGPADKCMGNF